jgi:hypothetical protein
MKRITSVLAVLIVAATAVAVAQQTNDAPAPDASVPWEKHKQSEGDAPTLEFQAGTAMSLNCELQADAYEQQQVVSHAAHCAAPLGSPSAAANLRPSLPHGASSGGDHVKDTPRQQGPNFEVRSGATSILRPIQPPTDTTDDDDGDNDEPPPK